MGNYALSKFTSPNAGVSVSELGTDTSTTAALGQAIQNIDTNAASLAGTETLTNKTLTAPHMTSPVVDSGGMTVTAGNLAVSAGQVYTATQTLTDAATIAWDMNSGAAAKVTLGGNRTLGAPTNLKDGGTYILRVIQDSTGSRTLAYNSVFKWPAGAAPVLSSGINAIDILTFLSDGTNLYGVAQKAFA